MKKLSFGRLVLVVLALLGVTDSILVHNKIVHDAGACVIFTGCQDVLHSSYALLLGISLAWWGLAFYISLALILLWWAISEKPRLLARLWCAGGFVFSLYLLGVQAFALHEFCSYCLCSLAIVTIISGTVFFGKTSLPERRPAGLQS